MVLIEVENTGRKFYLNKIEKHNLDIALQTMKDSVQDLVLCVDGPEGAGKSKKVRQIGYYCAKVLGSSFDLDGVKNIHNDIDKYIESSLGTNEFAVHILDESRQVLNRKRSMGKEAVRFTNYLSECRSKRQVHILVLPAFHDLDSYVTLWRMDMLWHLKKEYEETDKNESGYKLRLGEFLLFPNDNKLKMFYNFKYKYPNGYEARDRFNNVEVLSEAGLAAYEKQKDFLMRIKYGKDKKIILGKHDNGNRLQYVWQMLRLKYSLKEIYEFDAFGVSTRTLFDYDKRFLSDDFNKVK